MTVQVEPKKSGAIISPLFPTFYNPPAEYPFQYRNARKFTVTPKPVKGMEFSHWQISLKISKGQFDTKTSTEKAITVDITGKDGKATDVFLVAFFQPIEYVNIATSPEVLVPIPNSNSSNSSKPTKLEVLKAVDALYDMINRM